MREMVTKEIDGHIYKIVQFDTTKSLEIFQDLGCVLGEPMSSMMALSMGTGQTDDLEEAQLIGAVVKTLFEKMKEHNGIELIKRILGEDCFLCDGKTVQFDIHFAGGKGIAHLFKVLTAVLEVQYGDFLGGLRGAIASKVGDGFPLTTQKTSTGESGDPSSQGSTH